MVNSVQIINKNGEGIFVEGLAYILIPATNKKYLLYTINEKVDNDLLKIYIAEVFDGQVTEDTIPDNEWDDLRKKLLKMSHREEVPDVNYANIGSGPFTVGTAKKLAVTVVAEQAFKDIQASHTMVNNQTDASAMNNQPTQFFNTEVVNPAPTLEPSNVSPMPESGGNIFTNPPQPVMTNPEVAPVNPGNVVNPMPTAPVSPAPTPPQMVATPTPASTPMVPEQPEMAPQPMGMPSGVMAVNTIPTPVNPQNAFVQNPYPTPEPINQGVPVNPVPVTQPVAPEPSVQAPEASSVNTNRVVTDDEALAAIETIQIYLKQMSNKN